MLNQDPVNYCLNCGKPKKPWVERTHNEVRAAMHCSCRAMTISAYNNDFTKRLYLDYLCEVGCEEFPR